MDAADRGGYAGTACPILYDLLRELHRPNAAVMSTRSQASLGDEVDEASRALRLLAATHRGWTSGEHPLELEPALRPALTCTCSPQRRIRAFRKCAGKGWLHKLGGLLQLGQCFGAMRIFGGMRVMGVRSCGSCRDETQARFHHATVRTVLHWWRY